MSKKAKVTLHPDYRISQVDKRMYGAFLEPIGNWVYGGIYRPNHPTADDMGFRRDIIDAVKEFDLPALRFPGGNWISGWDWKNSIGPKDQRKAQLDLAWFQYEPNTVGHDEYIEWTKRVNTEPMYTINLGSEDLKSAFHLVEYSRHPGGTYWSDLRKKNGYPDPYPIKTWYLGNEMDGIWQIASWEKDPVGFGVRTHEISKVIKWIDNKAETVACGTCSPNNPTYPEWDMQVLEQCYETVDYLSLHHYHEVPEGCFTNYLNTTGIFEEFLKTTISTCDYMQSKMHSPKKMMISFDEFGVSFRESHGIRYGYGGRWDLEKAVRQFSKAERSFNMPDPDTAVNRGRMQAPQMLNALAVASVFLTFLRHADRVKIACFTSALQSAIAYDINNVWKNPSYYPYYHLNKLGRGMSLLPIVDGPTFSTPQYSIDNRHENHDYEGIQSIDTAAVLNEENEELNIFLVNRDMDDDIEVSLDLRGFEGYKLIEHIEMFTDDLNKRNSFDAPDMIKPSANTSTKLDGGKVTAVTRKLSWNVIRLGKK